MCSNFLHLCLSYIILYWFIYFLTCLACLIVFSYVFTNNRVGLYCLQGIKHFSLFYISVVISFLSLAGFPPFVGFWTKLLVSAQVSSSASTLFLITFWSLLLLSLLFYLRILRYFYAWSTDYTSHSITPATGHISVLIWLSLFICCGGFLINDIFLVFIVNLL